MDKIGKFRFRPSKLNMFWKPKTLDFVLFKEENRSTLLFLANNKIDTS